MAEPDRTPKPRNQADPPPLSPKASLERIVLREGFRAELVAAEPLVADPVAIDWDAEGRLWVVEMADYPSGIDGEGKPGGRVRVLEDTNGDGKYDRATLFAERLNFPNGLLVWRKGVLVTAAPDILYLEDTNGDGRADVVRKLYTGFLEGNQQLRVNGLRWGLDGWVYCASGGHYGQYGAGTKIKSSKTGKSVAVGSRDFRIQPDSGLIDPQSGPSQFGRNPDDWGDWFGVQNSHPLWHYVLEDHYLRRNPHTASPDPRRQLITPRNPKVYPAKAPQKRFHGFEQSGRFTSACSAMIYRDELLFPRGPIQHAFTCEPFHNLVHHAELTGQGVSFKAQRAAEEQTSEFFASKDRWCRPVMVRTGPDGALWVVDMYRYMIEHPRWLPEEGRKELKPFYRAGEDRGRIYRIFPDARPPRRVTPLAGLAMEDLVAALSSPNGTLRDKAQQQLHWRNDASSAGPLSHLATGGTLPQARLHALCTLDGLGQLSNPVLTEALGDAAPGVRRHAIRLAESRAGDDAELLEHVAALVDDPDLKVRFQLAKSLGAWRKAAAGPALAKLAIAHADNEYVMAAVWSSVHLENLPAMLDEVLRHKADVAQAGALAGQLLALAAALDESTSLVKPLGRIVDSGGSYEPWQYRAVAGLLDALERRGRPFAKLDALLAERDLNTQQSFRSLIAAARVAARDAAAGQDDRGAAIELLARDPNHRAADLGFLGGLLVPQVSGELQSAAVVRLGQLSDARVAEILLAGWKSHGPALRQQILATLLTRGQWLAVLLQRIESNAVLPADVDAASRQRLTEHRDKQLRARARRLLATATSSDRRKVLEDFQSALRLRGAHEAGAALFKKKCAACHKLKGIGQDVGPNLASLTNKTPEALLASILDPSRAVESKYLNYLASTADGRTFSGVLVSETGSSITLLGPERKTQVILRGDLEALRSTGKSMMPDGLEKDLTPQDLADVIEFLRAK